MKLNNYDAYLFDWDGTAAQTLSLWLPIVRKTLTQYNIEARDKEIVRKVFGNARSGLLELGVPEAELQKVFAEWDETAIATMPRVPLYDGISEVFDRLKDQRKKVGIITATIRPTMKAVFAAHGLHDTFDVVVTGSDVKAHKPDPEGLLFALNYLGVPQQRALMLGDSEKDIRAAHNAGIDSVLFYPPAHQPFHALEELRADKPTYTINSWQELLDQLQ